MDATHTTGWWTCSDCGVEAELPGSETAGLHVLCPDCDGVLVELWTWETVVEVASPAAPALRHAA